MHDTNGRDAQEAKEPEKVLQDRHQVDIRVEAPGKDAGLFEFVTYVGKLVRFDGVWSLRLEWVDEDKEGNEVGHRVRLPDDVLVRLFRGYETIMKKSRSARAEKGAATRKTNAARARRADLDDDAQPPELLEQ